MNLKWNKYSYAKDRDLSSFARVNGRGLTLNVGAQNLLGTSNYVSLDLDEKCHTLTISKSENSSDYKITRFGKHQVTLCINYLVATGVMKEKIRYSVKLCDNGIIVDLNGGD